MIVKLLSVIAFLIIGLLVYVYFIIKNHSNKEKDKNERRNKEDLSFVNQAKIAELNSLQKTEKVESIFDRIQTYKTAIERKENILSPKKPPEDTPTKVEKETTFEKNEKLSFVEIQQMVTQKINSIQRRRETLLTTER